MAVNEAPDRHRRTLSMGGLDELLGYRLRRAQVAVFQDFAASVGRLAITPGELGALMIVQANPGLKQSELAAGLGIDRSTLVAVVKELERRGLIRRARARRDRRAYALTLAPRGRRLLARARAPLAAHEARIAAALTPAEHATLRELLRRIAAD